MKIHITFQIFLRKKCREWGVFIKRLGGRAIGKFLEILLKSSIFISRRFLKETLKIFDINPLSATVLFCKFLLRKLLFQT